MIIEIDEEEGLMIIRAKGKLDALAAEEFADGIAGVVSHDAPRIVLDLSGVPFVSSAGLRVVIQTAKRTRERGRLAVCGLNPLVREVFELAGFDRILALCEDVESAKQVVRQ